MRHCFSVLVLLLLPAALACGGGGGSPVPDGGSSLIATFTPDTPSPGPNSSTMALGATSGDLVTIVVNVTDTADVYGAAFSIDYDPARTVFTGWSPGTILESGSHTPTYQIDDAQAGTLVVGATRNGNVPGVNVSGTRTLVRLTFRVNVAGSTPLTFQASELYDDAVPPQPLSGITWNDGALEAQ